MSHRNGKLETSVVKHRKGECRTRLLLIFVEMLEVDLSTKVPGNTKDNGARFFIEMAWSLLHSSTQLPVDGVS